MKRISLLVLMAALVSFVAVSCKKYEDGPTFSLASKKGRVAGEWTVEKATAYPTGGSSSDQTEYMQQTFQKLTFTKDGDVTVKTGSDEVSGTWEFDDDKENIVMTIESDVLTWEITRLKQKELWVKWNLSGGYYEIQFKQ